jgi:hypothetical protein
VDETLPELTLRRPGESMQSPMNVSRPTSAEVSACADANADSDAAPVASPATADAADLSPESTSEPAAPSARTDLMARTARAATAATLLILAWLVPGLGHLLLRRWQRALAFFLAVGGLAVSGYLMRGNVFQLHSQDPFGTLGFLADASSGVFYLLAHAFERAGPDVARAMGDYGTRFIAGAGIVNMLGVCDAYEVARGRRY